MAFPIPLKDERGQRRLRLLEDIAQLGCMTMTACVSKDEREDLRFLWRKDLLSVSSVLDAGKHKLVYNLSLAGDEAVQGADEARARQIERDEKKRQEEAEAA